jgi:hypothetical protein
VAEAQFTGPVRHCTGCGATVVFDGPALSIACSYCDSPMVDEGRASAAIDAVVPFQIPKRGAIERLRMYLEGRRFAPTELRRLRVHGRGLRGVLVPFWVYEGVVRSEYRAQIGVDWYRRETYEDRDGKTRTREVRETEWFPLSGTAARQIEDHVVSASVGLPAHEANPLEPFDLGRATRFDPRLLSGFEAELASVASGDAERIAIAELRDAEGARIQRELLPGDRNRLDWIASEVEIRARKLVLLPVWIANYRHGDVVLRLLVNGQTGEVVGRVPVARRKVALVVALALAVLVIAVLLAWRFGGSN